MFSFTGATAATEGMRSKALASSKVRVGVTNTGDIPAIPPTSGELGITLSKLVPICSKVEVIAAWAPLPTDIRVITAPTPMMMPSMVSAERNLLASSDLMAMVKDSISFTG